MAIAFLQRVSPPSISLSLMADFSTDAAGAILASHDFWNYTLTRIPAGVPADRYRGVFAAERRVCAAVVVRTTGGRGQPARRSPDVRPDR